MSHSTTSAWSPHPVYFIGKDGYDSLEDAIAAGAARVTETEGRMENPLHVTAMHGTQQRVLHITNSQGTPIVMLWGVDSRVLMSELVVAGGGGTPASAYWSAAREVQR